MITIDDANTIIEKWRNGFWYQIDCSKFNITSFPYDGVREFTQDSFRIRFIRRSSTGMVDIRLYSNNSFASRRMYVSYPDGTILSLELDYWSDFTLVKMEEQAFMENPIIFNVYIASNQPALPDNGNIYRCLFVPVSPLQVPVINGEFDDKFYVEVLGDLITAYTLDGEVVTINEDIKGTYFTLPSAEDCVIGTKYNDVSFPLYRVTFREFKSIPQLSVSTLYRGTPQKITLINTSTEEEITEFQAYYNGRLLKDNIIDLPYECDEYINVVVELKDPEYVTSTIKLKVATELKVCKTENQFINAINNGIKTMQLTKQGRLIISNKKIKDVTFINSHFELRGCVLDNVTFIETDDYTEGRIRLLDGTVLNNCILKKLTSLVVKNSILNNCNLKDIDFIGTVNLLPYSLMITGSISNCNIDGVVVLSDGDLTLTDNNFTGKTTKGHFPNFLYLTGEYTVTNNTFNLTGEWEELAFNMCIIKANNDFNPSSFISNNTFNLNITYEDEPTNTFYYCLVDDDKIRAVRL